MTEGEWLALAGQNVRIAFGYETEHRLGEFIACGGAGAVFDFPTWEGNPWVIKVLDPDSPIAGQENESLRNYRALIGFQPGLMKFSSWQGTLEYEGKQFSCYIMRKGKSLREVWENESERGELSAKPLSLRRILAFLIRGLQALKEAGLSHGDIKADNILLVKHNERFIPMFTDYGTVAKKMIPIGSRYYKPSEEEYASPLEERIAYDLHCLCMTFCELFGIEDDDLSPIDKLDLILSGILRTMRDNSLRAYERLKELDKLLKEEVEKKEKVRIPVTFYLSNIPRYSVESLPFDTFKTWRGYSLLRDRNALPGEEFDPLLLMEIPKGRYETVCQLLAVYDWRWKDFFLPIARCYDSRGNDYVLIHAPDDERKSFCGPYSRRIQEADGIPCTLENAWEKSYEMEGFFRLFARERINIEFSAANIWHRDGDWKLNLFEAANLELAKETAETVCINWKERE